AEPSKIFGKTLMIRVDHHAWIQELTFMKKDLLTKILAAQPALGISDIRFEVGK
ncbi:MAG: DUF721 domain-containing protein, partial [Deltaproteobacteria bacterium]|nr:DUF721 domain-containing protein [Deltaproteobacteria bacterium]